MAELRLPSQPVTDMHQSKHGAGKCGLCCACRGSRNCVLGWRAEPFTRFLSEQSEYKVLSLDQWVGFLRLTQEARAPVSPSHSVHARICATLRPSLSALKPGSRSSL